MSEPWLGGRDERLHRPGNVAPGARMTLAVWAGMIGFSVLVWGLLLALLARGC